MATEATSQERLKAAWAKFEARMKRVQSNMRAFLGKREDVEREDALRALHQKLDKQP